MLDAFTQPTVGNTVTVIYSGLAPPPGLGVAAVRAGAAVGLYTITALTATTITLQLAAAGSVAEAGSVGAGAGLVPLGDNGADGTNGVDGTNGTDGNTVLYGVGAPADVLGVNGNFYISTDTHYIYGPKASGTWPAGTSIIGPAGANGSAYPGVSPTQIMNGGLGSSARSAGNYTVGAQLRFTSNQTITGAEVYWIASGTEELLVELWSAGGAVLASGTANVSATGIATISFSSPYTVTAYTLYTLSVRNNTANFYCYWDYTAATWVKTQPFDAGNGILVDNWRRYAAGHAFPNATDGSFAYNVWPVRS